MPEKKLKVYCETSFGSYLNGRRTPMQHIAVKQAATLQWWQEIAPKCEVYISQHVGGESSKGDDVDAARRAESMRESVPLDGLIPEVLILRQPNFLSERGSSHDKES